MIQMMGEKHSKQGTWRFLVHIDVREGVVAEIYVWQRMQRLRARRRRWYREERDLRGESTSIGRSVILLLLKEMDECERENGKRDVPVFLLNRDLRKMLLENAPGGMEARLFVSKDSQSDNARAHMERGGERIAWRKICEIAEAGERVYI